MATQITKWQAKDGSLHDSSHAADRHDTRKAVRNDILNMLDEESDYLGRIELDDMLKLATESEEFYMLIRAYREA